VVADAAAPPAAAPVTLWPPTLNPLVVALAAGPVAAAAAVPGPKPTDVLAAAPGALPLTVPPVGLDVTLKPNPGAGLETECADDVDGVDDVDEPWPAGAAGAWPPPPAA